jgi:gliding motility-associated-like protein
MRAYRFLLILLFPLFASVAANALTAGFTASTTSGCAPLLVNFTNTTTPAGGTTYSWTFGTFGGSTLTNPSSYFPTPGTHLVTLVATNGGVTSTFTMTITVYPPPTVSFTSSATSACPGAPITFTSTTLGGVPGTVTCTWYWGDGGSSVGSPATHTYASPGNYTVSLFATNAQGCQANLSMPAYIHIFNRPVAVLAPTYTGCNPPTTITFSTSSSGAPPLSYSWLFGSGSTGAGPTPSHTYTATGSFPVKVIVTDGNGCVDSTTSTVVISNLTAAFTNPDTACLYSNVTFTNTSVGYSSCNWTYGDGGSSGGPTGSHAYSTPGTYTVTLTVVSGSCTQTVSHTIVIRPGPTATFAISPDVPCPAPSTVTYTGSSSTPGTVFAWIFEGGATAAGNPVSYTYGSNGIKTVKMIVTDPVSGCRDTVTRADTIYNLDFRANGVPDRGCVPLSVSFVGVALYNIPPPGWFTYPVPIATYSWDFGDGAGSSTLPTPTHIYTAVGIYTVHVTATTANGCVDSDVVIIHVGAPPEVTFTATPLHICYSSHIPVVFTPTIVVGPVDEYDWSFGDGGDVIFDTTAPPAPVSHTYTVPGTFTVTVTPYWRGCPGPPYTIVDYVTIDSPKAIIGDSVFCSPNTRVKFWDSSLGDDTHLWMFGDGTTSVLDDPIHDFPATGTYVVKLATHNIASGCRDTAARTIILSGPVPDFTASATTICKGQSITFTSTTTSPTYVTNYWWYADGWGPVPGSTNSFYTKPFTSVLDTGFHTINFVIRNINGCFDTLSRPNFVHVGGPSVSFTGGPVTGCVPLSVTFTDGSIPVSTTTLATHFWRFGDGFTGSGTPITHIYTAPGFYTVWHIVTDSRGCMDSAVRPSYIHPTQPTAAFTVGLVNACVNSSVPFTVTTPGVVSAVWDFGDGGSSTLTAPTHMYGAPGLYNVKLTVTDVNGCIDDTTLVAAVNVTKPFANFKMSDSVSVCPPLFVNFTNLSTGATTYSWDLGDGTFSTFLSPSDMYITSGLYNIVLVATNIYGCRDTMQKSVNIFGYAGAFTYSPTQGCVPLTVNFVATLTNIPFITWDFSDGVTSSISFTDTISHTYTVPGAYVPKLVLSDNTGCQTSSIGLDTIFVDDVIPKSSTFPSPVCIGIPFNFIDSSTTWWSPITTWEWTYDGNTSTIASPTYTIYTPGTYPITLKVTNGWGCTGTTTTDIVVDPPPVVTASNDTVVCVGDAATLLGYGAVTYTWDPPATLSCTACNPTMASPTVETMYTVTGTDARGCIDTATVTVGLRTHTTSRAWGDTAVCEGVPVQLFDTGGTTYLWLPPLGLNSNTVYNPIASSPYTTIYTVVAKLAGCIPDTNTVTVFIYPTPTVDAGPNQKLLAGSLAYIKATGTDIATYSWSPDETLSCSDCFNPVASMSVMTTYYVDVASNHGCKASDSVTILLYCDNSQVFIPNAFTPNGDGQNDVFYPRGMGLKYIKTFRIYNRWGELLFQREGISLNDPDGGWDGSFKGETPRPDVYVYILEAVCYTGEDIHLKGDVSILK